MTLFDYKIGKVVYAKSIKDYGHIVGFTRNSVCTIQCTEHDVTFLAKKISNIVLLVKFSRGQTLPVRPETCVFSEDEDWI